MAQVEYACPIGGETLVGTPFMAEHKIPCRAHFEQEQGSDQVWHRCREGCRVAFNSLEARDAHETQDHISPGGSRG